MVSKKKESSVKSLTLTTDPRQFELQTGLLSLPAILRTEDDEKQREMAQKVAKEALKQLDEKKAQIIDPIQKALGVMRKNLASAREPWEKLLDGVRALVLEREFRLEAEKRKENERLARKAEKRGEEQFASDLRTAASHEVQSHAEAVSIRRTWKAKIVDAGKVPVEFNGLLLRPVDEAQLSKLAKIESMRAFSIPGVEWYEEKTAALF